MLFMVEVLHLLIIKTVLIKSVGNSSLNTGIVVLDKLSCLIFVYS